MESRTRVWSGWVGSSSNSWRRRYVTSAMDVISSSFGFLLFYFCFFSRSERKFRSGYKETAVKLRKCPTCVCVAWSLTFVLFGREPRGFLANPTEGEEEIFTTFFFFFGLNSKKRKSVGRVIV